LLPEGLTALCLRGIYSAVPRVCVYS